ncbi:MAG: hypothetical protein LUG16_07455 [Candidatus Gastranaerophilales bacterium]|nr:hypothetical protein [Candidatus Gastranaerophilales bacterium]
MTKYYSDDYTVLKVEDNGEQYLYYKSSDSWKPVIKKRDIEYLLAWNDSFIECENMKDVEYFKSGSCL